jgi:DNA-directed RNA polymerase subunit alpha
LPGSAEDVTDIVLNVKQIALKFEGEGPKRLHLTATGPGAVHRWPDPDLGRHRDHQSRSGHLPPRPGRDLNMELTADVGKATVRRPHNRPLDAPIGLDPVDALYSPVRQVAYKVENTRVGQELDYDKLTAHRRNRRDRLPRGSVGYAARILQDQLALFVGFDDQSYRAASPMIGQADPSSAPMASGAVPETTDTNQLNRYLLKKVDELELSSVRPTA